MTATNNKLVPHKRFPEFENSGDWEEKKLEDIGEIITGKTPSTSNKNLWKDEIHFVTPSDMKGTKYQYITERMVTNINIKLLPVGTVMFSCIATIGKIAIAKVVCTTNQQINSIIIDVEKINNEFVYYSLQSIISKIKAKYEKDAFSIINKTEFSNIIIQVSPLSAEQQKIADFLSSFDELIELEQKKLDKLQEYKKGSLQNLFPKDNQKVPDLRFPEFKNSGEWVDVKLKEILKIRTGNKNLQDRVENGLYPFFVRSEKVEKIDTYSYDGEAILTAGDGKIGEIFHYINGKFDFHQRVYMLSNFKSNIYAKYIYYIFSKDFKKRALNMSAKNTVDSVRMEMISDMGILIPSYKEQQKIAEFLSSVDELIIEQINKVKKLQEYKKGLLQQLFPN